MLLLGCFKVVADLERAPAEAWKQVSGTRVETDYLPTAISCYDESALELMLRCAEKAGRRPALTALTCGGSRCDPYLKTLLALGFDQGIRVQEEDRTDSPERSAAALSAVCAGLRPDVIVAGSQSADGNHGLVPLLLAERLGLPCYTQVLDFSLLSETELELRQQTDSGVAIRKITPPCVLTVGNVPGGYLRVPTLRAKMAAGGREITLLPPMKEAVEEGLCLTGLAAPDRTRAGTIIPGETAEERVRCFLDRYGKEWGLR